MKVLICKPRVDMTFKDFGQPIPDKIGPPTDKVKAYWADFVGQLSKVYPDALILEKPLFQFTPELIGHYDPDVTFIPHKQQNNFPVSVGETRYYMQTVFPWLFGIDPVGWEGGASVWKNFPMGDATQTHFDDLKDHITNGGTKFEHLQPQKDKNPFEPGYILFVCQLPHDETIKYHSDVEVIDGLRESIKYAKEQGKRIIVKGHPVNPKSMTELLNETFKHDHATWVDRMHLHPLMEDASEVHVINSGTGYEAILFGKKVRTYGRCLYEHVVNQEPDMELYRSFINGWYGWCYDSQTGRGFERLK